MATYSDQFHLRDKSLVSVNDIADAIDGLRTERSGNTSVGSSNAYAVTVTPGLTTDTLVAGVLFGFTPNFTNTGTSTLAANSSGAKPLKYLGQDLVGGELVVGRRALVQYDGTNYVLMNHGGGYKTYGVSLSSSMATSAISFDYARYQRHGDLVFFEVLARVTLAGTASNSVSVSLPIIAAPIQQYVSGFFYQPTPNEGVAYGDIGVSATQVAIKKYNASNYAVGGVASVLQVYGSYFVG